MNKVTANLLQFHHFWCGLRQNNNNIWLWLQSTSLENSKYQNSLASEFVNISMCGGAYTVRSIRMTTQSKNSSQGVKRHTFAESVEDTAMMITFMYRNVYKRRGISLFSWWGKLLYLYWLKHSLHVYVCMCSQQKHKFIHATLYQDSFAVHLQLS